MRVDTHIHLWTADCTLTPDRAYTPEVWSSAEDFIAVLDAHQMTHGIVVQPSILGTDNSYMMRSLRKYPNRLRGIAVIPPDLSEAKLAELDGAGVVGIRLNVLTTPGKENVLSPQWKKMYARLAELKWVVTYNANGPTAVALLDTLRKLDLDVVADHFGKVDPKQGLKDESFQALLKGGRRGRTWVKLDPGNSLLRVDMRPYVDALKDALGPERLTWGSNWPWPRYHFTVNYRQHLDLLEQWFDDEATRRRVLGENPAQVFRIPA
ncbi:MAG: amidohydrolase family protein [Candidatus Lambdaproteobacteria bacterium]|nr:amidohydrolase family protein [Candidatus Lambdaproteobacteria bacterium]